MKKLLIGCLVSLAAYAASEKGAPTVAVTDFKQEVDHFYDHCKGYWWQNQNQLRTVLEKELAQAGLRVVERVNIRKMHEDEFEMKNLNPKSKNKSKRFEAAKYSISGGIAELGICEEEQDTGVHIGGIVSLLGGPQTDLNLKVGGATSKVRLVAKLVSVETGTILQTFESETESNDKSLGVEAAVVGIGGEHRRKSVPPIERATNEGLKKIAQQIQNYLTSSN